MLGRFVVVSAAAVWAMSFAPAQAETVRVVIADLVYSPAEVRAKVGDTITWVNEDVLDHTATVKGGFDVMIPAKKSASFIVKKAGTMDYYCRFHPNMTARIVVSPK